MMPGLSPSIMSGGFVHFCRIALALAAFLPLTARAGAPHAPLGGDLRDDTIYFVMTTRFFDGDPGNDFYDRDRLKAGDPQWRGDFKGLIEQLPHIKELGFTALWITPPVESRSGLDYHGY